MSRVPRNRKYKTHYAGCGYMWHSNSMSSWRFFSVSLSLFFSVPVNSLNHFYSYRDARFRIHYKRKHHTVVEKLKRRQTDHSKNGLECHRHFVRGISAVKPRFLIDCCSEMIWNMIIFLHERFGLLSNTQR